MPADDRACAGDARDPLAVGVAGSGTMGYVSTDVPAPPPVESHRRSGRPARDMLLSMAVLLVPIFILLGVYKFVFSGDAPIAVDPTYTWDTARHSAHFTVLQPTGLPKGWTPISANFMDGTLRVGYVTPAGTGLQLIESDRPIDTLVPAELGTEAKPGSLVTINDRPWRAYPVVRADGAALVLADGGRTVIVVGTATAGDLRTFATSLR
jgi:uncharacterized protein DUF4245